MKSIWRFTPLELQNVHESSCCARFASTNENSFIKSANKSPRTPTCCCVQRNFEILGAPVGDAAYAAEHAATRARGSWRPSLSWKILRLACACCALLPAIVEWCTACGAPHPLPSSRGL